MYRATSKWYQLPQMSLPSLPFSRVSPSRVLSLFLSYLPVEINVKVFVLDFKIRWLSMAQIFLKVRNKQQALFSTFGCSVSLGCCASKQWQWRVAGLSHPRRCTRPWTSPAGWTALSCWGPGPPCPYSPVSAGPSGMPLSSVSVYLHGPGFGVTLSPGD